MKLHEYKNAFEGAIVTTAQHFGISEIYIEKDYWVTYALKQIFTNPATENLVVFKGGTSLSKCYRIIDRFSEDIDLVLVQKENETGNALKKNLKLVTNSVGGLLTVLPNHPLENKQGKIRKLVYGYDKIGANGMYGMVRDQIVVEVSSFGNSVPSQKFKIHTMITEFIGTTNNLDLIATYGLEPFEIKVLAIERTFCEKIISMVRFSYSDTPLEELTRKVRHTYDLHLLLEQQKIKSFLQSKSFEIMLNQVGNDDFNAIPNDKEWLDKHPSESLFFKETSKVWETMNKVYKTTFKELVTGELPNEKEVLTSLLTIGERLKTIDWQIN